MTSSGTGQSSSVDVTHSLWRMTNPPCRIVPLLPLMTLYVWGTDVSSCSFSDVQIMATLLHEAMLPANRPGNDGIAFCARRSSPTASECSGRGSASRARVTAAHSREDR
jgi:hypothetical protein